MERRPASWMPKHHPKRQEQENLKVQKQKQDLRRRRLMKTDNDEDDGEDDDEGLRLRLKSDDHRHASKLLVVMGLGSAAAYSKEGPKGNTWNAKDCRAIPLCIAADGGKLTVVKALLAKQDARLPDEGGRLDIDEQDKYGFSTLMIAALGEASVVEALLQAGARTDLKDKDGRTALDDAKGEDAKALLRAAAKKTPAQRIAEAVKQDLRRRRRVMKTDDAGDEDRSNATQREGFMRRCIELARSGGSAHPFGALVADPRTGQVLAEGRNKGGIAHAEMDALTALTEVTKKRTKAERKELRKRLELYTTAEPCAMCMGAAVWAKLRRVIYGSSIPYLASQGVAQIGLRARALAASAAGGGVTSRQVEVVGGVLAAETDALYANATHCNTASPSEQNTRTGHDHDHSDAMVPQLLAALQADLGDGDGDFVQLPGQKGYDEALAMLRRPPLFAPLAVFQAGADHALHDHTLQVARAALRVAKSIGARVVVVGGGQGLALDGRGAIVLDLRGTGDVSVRPAEGGGGPLVSASGGATIGDINGALQARQWAMEQTRGRAARAAVLPAGVSDAVGFGSALQGGVGLLTRRHGLSLDRLRSATLLTADGQLHELSDQSVGDDAELWWGVRGGGHLLGAVLSATFEAAWLEPKGIFVDSALVRLSSPRVLAEVVALALLTASEASSDFSADETLSLTLGDGGNTALLYYSSLHNAGPQAAFQTTARYRNISPLDALISPVFTEGIHRSRQQYDKSHGDLAESRSCDVVNRTSRWAQPPELPPCAWPKATSAASCTGDGEQVQRSWWAGDLPPSWATAALPTLLAEGVQGAPAGADARLVMQQAGGRMSTTASAAASAFCPACRRARWMILAKCKSTQSAAAAGGRGGGCREWVAKVGESLTPWVLGAYSVDLSRSEQSREKHGEGNEEDGLVQAFGKQGAARLRALRRKHDPSGVFSYPHRL